MSSDEENFYDTGLFCEPEGYFPPPPPATYVEHSLKSGEVLTLRLVGRSTLWGHILWNAGKTVAGYLEEHATELIEGKNVLELGAGAGLPSLVCALKGAQHVLVTDYTDPQLIENLEHNIATCHLPKSARITAKPFVWGHDPRSLLAELSNPDQEFDLLILADLVFNHSEQPKLISTVQSTLRKGSDSQALVFFTPHRPWLYEKDMAFFELARKGGFTVEKIVEAKMEVMFKTDLGDEDLRRTVFGYRLRWAEV